jgi:hypothetical protein
MKNDKNKISILDNPIIKEDNWLEQEVKRRSEDLNIPALAAFFQITEKQVKQILNKDE